MMFQFILLVLFSGFVSYVITFICSKIFKFQMFTMKSGIKGDKEKSYMLWVIFYFLSIGAILAYFLFGPETLLAMLKALLHLD